jgi:hypothetical protein
VSIEDIDEGTVSKCAYCGHSWWDHPVQEPDGAIYGDDDFDLTFCSKEHLVLYRTSAIAELTKENAVLRVKVEKLGFPSRTDNPWSTASSVERVISFARRALKEGYDDHGWEELQAACESLDAALTTYKEINEPT